MNFFQHQDRARKLTMSLLVLFGLAVAALIAAIYFTAVSAAGLVALQTGEGPVDPSWWNPQILLLVTVGTLMVIGIASAVRTSGLRAGGSSVAEMLGGRLLAPGTVDLRERRLLNVVEEMSIASSVPMPQIFVLDKEPGINAFAAGHSVNDAAVVVTKGTLERLNRDELQGVVAHEFSHILNGDMRMNIRLMGVIFGILVIGLIGRGILRIRWTSRGSRGKGGGGIAVVVLIGLALLIIGYVGLFFGRLIKAAVSRQREFLADASAVQFTRNPLGVGGALKKIGGFSEGSDVQSRAAEETSHFFFSEAVHYSMFSSLFRTHPNLVERIRRIDPGFQGEYPEVPEEPVPVMDYTEGVAQALGFAPVAPDAARSVERGTASSAAYASSLFPASAEETEVLQLRPDEVAGRVGEATTRHQAYAAGLLDRLPDSIHRALGDPLSASALIFALLLDQDPAIARRQREQIEMEAGPELRREAERLAEAAPRLDPRVRLPLAQLAFPSLRLQTPQQVARFTRTCEMLIAEDADLSVFEYAVNRTLLDRLTRPPHKAGGTGGGRKIGPVLRDCRVLLSCLAWFGNSGEEERARRAFEAGYIKLDPHGWEPADLLPQPESCLSALDRSLVKLRHLRPSLRQQVLDAAAHTVLLDGTVSVDEAELLRVVADALDCPLPPLIQEEKGQPAA